MLEIHLCKRIIVLVRVPFYVWFSKYCIKENYLLIKYLRSVNEDDYTTIPMSHIC